MLRTRGESVTAVVFVAPATLLLALFVLWPTARMVLLSFRDASWAAPDAALVGGENYTDLVADPAFREALRNTFVFTLLVVPAQTALALLLAAWVHGRGWWRRVLRVSVFLPTTISLAVLAVVWHLMLEPATATGAGLINGLLVAVGLPAQPFLTNRWQALPTIALMSVWQGVGLQMMVFLAGLQQIPAQRYEAARIDGAGPWRRLVHVTLPGLAPTAVFVVMVTTIFALRLFVQPFLMTRGGPSGATISLVQYIYESAFFTRDLGLACAAGSVFFAIVLAITIALRRLLRFAEALE
jgi:multiple sugar transport system permease protein